MGGAQTSRHLPLFPAAGFVLVWSSGYIAGPYGVEAMSPLMLVAVRFVLAAAIAWALARALRGPLRVTRADAVRIGLSGFVLNGVQFGAMYLAFDAGLGATLASLMHSLSPVLTALLAAVFLGERLTPLQVVGFVVGVGGVLLVLGPDVDEAGGALGIVCGVVSVLGPEHRHARPALDRARAGPAVVGHHPVRGGRAAPARARRWWSRGRTSSATLQRPGIALLYLAVVNSIIGLGLLGILVRARGAGAAASVFFLMPPVTAVLAWLILGETLDPREIAGLVITVVAVAAATRSAAADEFEPWRPSEIRTDRSIRAGITGRRG